jgi:2,5-diketo-D-gluconate reductase A
MKPDDRLNPSGSISVDSVTLSNGVSIPQLGFGTLNVTATREDTDVNRDAVASIVGAALAAGYRHIDTAQMYGNERGVGAAIVRSGLSRDAVFVATKLGNASHRPEDVRPAVEQSLQRLALEQIDLLLMHWPLPTLYGGDFVSTWRAMIRLVNEGLARAIGVSNFQPAHLDRIIDATGVVPVVNQVELHPYFGNVEVVAACARHGIAVEAWSPLGQAAVLADPIMASIAARHNRTVAQVVLRWHLQRGRIVIPKSVSAERMRENLGAPTFDLTRDDLASIDALDRGSEGRRGPHPDTFAWVPSSEAPTP